jgi:hypothetical protein
MKKCTRLRQTMVDISCYDSVSDQKPMSTLNTVNTYEGSLSMKQNERMEMFQCVCTVDSVDRIHLWQ